MSRARSSTAPLDLAVVVVSHRTRDLTVGCIRRLEAALGELSAQVVVWDNASGDGTVDAVRALGIPWVDAVQSDANLGYGAAANAGLARCPPSRHVAVLNADLAPEAGSLERLVAVLDEDPECGIVGPRLLDSDGETRPVRGVPTARALLFQHTALRYLRFGRSAYRAYKAPAPPGPDGHVEMLSGAALVIRRSVFEQLGGFDERFFLYFEEVDLCVRCRRAGHTLRWEASAVIGHEGGASSGPRRGEALVWYLTSLLRFVQRTEARGLGFRALFKTSFVIKMGGDVVRDAVAWLRPDRRREKAAELRLACWFARHGVWRFLRAR